MRGLRLGADPRDVVAVLNAVLRGKLDCTGTVTLAAGATSTTITDSRIGIGSVLLLMPKTASAAAALATTYVTPGDGAAVVTHANAPTLDRTFGVAILG